MRSVSADIVLILNFFSPFSSETSPPFQRGSRTDQERGTAECELDQACVCQQGSGIPDPLEFWEHGEHSMAGTGCSTWLGAGIIAQKWNKKC